MNEEAQRSPDVLVCAGVVPILERPRDDAALVTEIVPGERVAVLEGRPGWLRVVVPSHATRLDGRGYPGWARPDALSRVTGWEPDLQIVAGNDDGLPLGLPLGTLLRREGDEALMPDGRTVAAGHGTLRGVGVKVTGSPAEVSRRLLGLPYRWGGTDSSAGMDCSGLVFRVMGSLGVAVPRDAVDQFERAPIRSRDGWENARTDDLVFFGEDAVTHVGFYLGDGAYISEHGSAGTVVRGVEQDAYWGFARYA